MIGFISRAYIPKLIIQFIIGVLVLVVGMGAVSLLSIHGNRVGILFLLVFVVAFKVGERAGEAIWERVEIRRLKP